MENHQNPNSKSEKHTTPDTSGAHPTTPPNAASQIHSRPPPTTTTATDATNQIHSTFRPASPAAAVRRRTIRFNGSITNMHYTTKLGFGALVTVGAVAAFYSTQSRRRTLTTTTAPITKALPIDGEDVDVGGAVKGSEAAPAPATRSRSASASSTQTENQKEAALDTQWQKFTDRLSALNTSILSTISLGNVLPDWSIGLPVWITKLQRELNMEPGSLADTIWTEARDPLVNPEVARDAKVRLSADLCDEEKEFLRKRREHTKKALAKYLEIPEEEIHPDDVPIIASTGSGGGLRAMVAGAGYYQALHESGLYDCITYTAGVSGSCWLQSIYLSSIGQQDFGKVIEHLKTRIGVHIAYPPAVLDLIDTVPTNKYLLRGIVEKLRVGYSQFGLVDLYGLLLGARLLVPEDPHRIDDRDLKLSQQKRFLENGEQPLPIYTAVRHEIPGVGNETENKDSGKIVEAAEAKQKEKEAQDDSTQQSDWFQWFEATPFEFYSEDLEAGIPTWGLGRKYEYGHNLSQQIPEIQLPLLLGIWGSAFCATLSHYYAEIRPFVTSVSIMSTLDSMVLQRKASLVKVHPFDPASVPNFIKGLKDQLPPTCPESLHDAETIQLMDSGMSNNLGVYPLMRKGRGVDVVIAFDSSADVKVANWIGYVEGYAKQRKIRGWPVSIGWPKEDETTADTVKELEDATAASKEEAEEKMAEAAADGHEDIQAQERSINMKKKSLGPCTIWVGSTETRESDEEPPKGKAVEEEWEVMRPEAGIVVAYLPLIPHKDVPGVDPDTSAYLSTWNFEWTPEQIDSLTSLAKANFAEGKDQLKRTIRAVYERKKKQRLERETQEEEIRREEERKSGDSFA